MRELRPRGGAGQGHVYGRKGSRMVLPNVPQRVGWPMTLAQLVIDACASGRSVEPRTWESVPPVQWDIYWHDISPLCPSRLVPDKVKQRNALRIELLPDDGPRCSRMSPDGRGLTWFMSGGSTLAYGKCERRTCPRCAPTNKETKP